MKTWIKGGLIFVFIGFVSFHLLIFLGLNGLISENLFDIFYPFFSNLSLDNDLLTLEEMINNIFIRFILTIIQYFIFGAIIGLIISKLKSHKSNNLPKQK